jgi:hypothetical protein
MTALVDFNVLQINDGKHWYVVLIKSSISQAIYHNIQLSFVLKYIVATSILMHLFMLAAYKRTKSCGNAYKQFYITKAQHPKPQATSTTPWFKQYCYTPVKHGTSPPNN